MRRADRVQNTALFLRMVTSMPMKRANKSPENTALSIPPSQRSGVRCERSDQSTSEGEDGAHWNLTRNPHSAITSGTAPSYASHSENKLKCAIKQMLSVTEHGESMMLWGTSLQPETSQNFWGISGSAHRFHYSSSKRNISHSHLLPLSI